MISKMKWVVPLLFFCLIALFFWKGLQKDPNQLPSALINQPFPTFEAPSLFHPAQRLTPAMFKGQVSILTVFASWCDACVKDHSVLNGIAQEGIARVFGLDYKDERKDAQNFLKAFGNPFKAIIYDPKGALALDLGVYGVPETFLIDKNGIIRYKYVGSLNMAVWKKQFLPKVRGLL